MTVSNVAENTLLDDVFNAGSGIALATDPYVSLHTGDPGETGANEVTGGSYARQQVAFGAAASGTLSNSAQVDFASMPATTVFAWGVWDAVSAGNCLWTGWLSTVAKLGVATAADLTGNTIQSPSHGFVNDDRVVFEQVEDVTVPTGVTLGTVYYVLATTSDTFTFSTTLDGSAVDVTAVGAALARLVVPRSPSAGQTVRIAAGELDVFLD
jgi:hypothetical protein